MRAATAPLRRIRPGLGEGELVSVACASTSAAPRVFTWRGRRYKVRSVEAFQAPGGEAGADRQWFRVRAQCGLRALLSHDLRTRRWRMEGVLSYGGR